VLTDVAGGVLVEPPTCAVGVRVRRFTVLVLSFGVLVAVGVFVEVAMAVDVGVGVVVSGVVVTSTVAVPTVAVPAVVVVVRMTVRVARTVADAWGVPVSGVESPGTKNVSTEYWASLKWNENTSYVETLTV
jgi:hypothetical protein